MTTKQMLLEAAERLKKFADLYDVIDAVKNSISVLNDQLYDATTTLESAMSDLDAVMEVYKDEEE